MIRALFILAIILLRPTVAHADNEYISSLNRPNPYASMLPCDAAVAAGTPFTAFHSMFRACSVNYSGNLFLLYRSSDATAQNVAPVAAGGYANLSTISTFCGANNANGCSVEEIYDQTGNGNNLVSGTTTQPTVADQGEVNLQATAHGALVPYLEMNVNQTYNKRTGTTVPTGSNPQSAYMLVEGLNISPNCCNGYGNAESTYSDNGNGHMNALVYQSASTGTQLGAGQGPWAMVSLENVNFTGCADAANPNNPSNFSHLAFVTSKTNGQKTFVIRGGDPASPATSPAGQLTTFCNGFLASSWTPMHMEGGLTLNHSGDNSGTARMSFFEGGISASVWPDELDYGLYQNISNIFKSTPVTVFSPASLSNLKAWWDAANQSTFAFSTTNPLSSGNAVSSWTDSSGNAYAFTQSTGTAQPWWFPNLLNGRGGVEFDPNALKQFNTNVNLASTSAPNIFGSSFGVYVVGDITYFAAGAGTVSFLNSNVTSGAVAGLGAKTTNQLVTFGSLTASNLAATKSYLGFGQPAIVEYFSSAGVSTAGGTLTVTPYLNGTVDANGAQGESVAAYTPNGLNVGVVSAGGTRTPYYSMFELIITDGTESAATRQKIEGYLACKWGLRGYLPSGHPYFSACP